MFEKILLLDIVLTKSYLAEQDFCDVFDHQNPRK